MTTRHFTRQQLDAWDLPDAWADDSPEILHREQVNSRRWVSVHELVFRAPDDGLTYLVHYEQGLTESQDGCDPWNYDDEIKGVEVEQRPVVVQEWKPVGEQSAEAPTASAPSAVVVEQALRRYLAHLDYDLHKGIECGEETGEDTYPEEAQRFLQLLAEAGTGGAPTT